MNSPNKEKFREIILNSANQLSSDPKFINQLNISRRQFNKILICGMGGSALAGEMLFGLKLKNFDPFNLNLPVFIHRSYDLPPDTDQKTLIICLSYSGNTEETISAYQAAKNQEWEIAGVTSGGKLAEIFDKNGTPWIKMPEPEMPPRCAVGYQLVALAKILMAYGLLPPYTQKELAETAAKISPAEIENSAREFSEKIAGKIPVIYSSDENRALARIWKIKINENAKIPAFWNVLPELNHNEMVGWPKNDNRWPFAFIWLSDSADSPQIKKRLELTSELLADNGWQTEKIELGGATALEKMFWALAFGDWVSYFLALSSGVDPAPVEAVEKFKKLLSA